MRLPFLSKKESGDDGSVAVLERPEEGGEGTDGGEGVVSLGADEGEIDVARELESVLEEVAANAPKKRPFKSLSEVTKVRRVVDGCIEDTSGQRWGVWEVGGCDVGEARFYFGWSQVLNSIEYPVQVLIRQHSPDYRQVRRDMYSARPDRLKHEDSRIAGVADSVLDYLEYLEGDRNVVERRWYMIASDTRSSEFRATLGQSGFSVERLGDDELRELYLSCTAGLGLTQEPAGYQLRDSSGHFQLNHRDGAVYEVNRWPRRISHKFLEELLRLGEEMDVSMWIGPMSKRESNSHLQMQLSRFQGARLAALQKGKMVNPEVEMAIEDLGRISDGVERGTNRLFRRGMALCVYGRDQRRLREISETVESYFRSSMAGLRLLKYRQARSFHLVMPVCRQGPGGVDMTDGETMVRMFPFGPPDLDDREGVLLGLDERSKTPVFVDAFSPRSLNGHMTIMARSGAGKSFSVKIRVLRESTRDVPVYIVDPEGEFGVLAEELGGEIFVPGAEGYGLNPFIYQYSTDTELVNRVSGLGALVEVMLGGEVDQTLRATIDRCLMGFYRGEMMKAATSDEVLGTTGMLGFHSYLESGEAKGWGGDTLAHLLAKFATGSARFLFQGEGRNLLENELPVTSFNLKYLPGSLKPVATSVCSEVVWGLAVTRPRPRLLVVDEVWTVLATKAGAESLITIVKRARKHKLGMVCITQDVQDFLSEDRSGGTITGHAGRSLLQNSALKLAFQQDPAALYQVADALQLQPWVVDYLRRCGRGQGVLVGAAGDTYPFVVVATDEERDLVEDESWREHGEFVIPDELVNGSLKDMSSSVLLRDDLPEGLMGDLVARSRREVLEEGELAAALELE